MVCEIVRGALGHAYGAEAERQNMLKTIQGIQQVVIFTKHEVMGPMGSKKHKQLDKKLGNRKIEKPYIKVVLDSCL